MITGGSSGIGLEMAARFLAAGNEVIITGRHEERLHSFKASHPGVQIKVSDAGSAAARSELADWATREFPRLNVLVNNAGIQRKIDLMRPEAWSATAREIDINRAAFPPR